MVLLLSRADRPLRKPDWLKVKLPAGPECNRVEGVLSDLGLHSVCQEALCPNRAECFHSGTATFLILGRVCTRSCRYCNVGRGRPEVPDPREPLRLAEAVLALGLRYVVITSVSRDDLPDGGADLFARSIAAVRHQVPGCRVEVLIPDFQGDRQALERVLAAEPDVVSHNLEVAPALFRELRPDGDYRRSLEVLDRLMKYNDNGSLSLNKQGILEGIRPAALTKSGFMVGFGETWEAIEGLLRDLRAVRCELITVGQYQQPTQSHWPVVKYYHPDEFAAIGELARGMGFRHVEAGPLVRSSYHAARALPG